MTAGERRFLELELEVLLRRFKKNQENDPVGVLKSAYREGYETLVNEIGRKAANYVKEVVFAGSGGYYLKSETSELVEKLNYVVNCPVSKEKLRTVLFAEPDMVQVKKLTAGLRAQVQNIVTEYQNHAGKGE